MLYLMLKATKKVTSNLIVDRMYSIVRYVLRTQSNIYDGTFLRK